MFIYILKVIPWNAQANVLWIKLWENLGSQENSNTKRFFVETSVAKELKFINYGSDANTAKEIRFKMHVLHCGNEYKKRKKK